MNTKHQIIICMGSSCFARGNNETRKIIQDFIADHQLENKVEFSGSHCFSNCKDGPVVQIDGELFKNITKNNIIEILTERLIL
ncbi:MAG: (2Fe-2S) ferredoxin domain-containing protein [Bacteroidales bacterium]|nr:(2Fe-2S) ferredoxin domain-containing protein [Bacteroidales bacterium]